MIFCVTAIGCGLAGFDPDEIAPLFRNHPQNVVLPDGFVTVLEDDMPKPGARYRKNGKEFLVQFVQSGHVYGLLYRADSDLAKWERQRLAGEIPEDLIGMRRLTEADFAKSVEGAEVIAEAW